MTEPYIKLSPGDVIRSEHWNEIQIKLRNELQFHTHGGGERGTRIGGDSIDANAELNLRQVQVSGSLTAARITTKALDGVVDLQTTSVATDRVTSKSVSVSGPLDVKSLTVSEALSAASAAFSDSLGARTLTVAERLTVNLADKEALSVADGMLVLGGASNPLRLTTGWTNKYDDATSAAQIANDTAGDKQLMIAGNRSAGKHRMVGVWDQLEVHGKLVVSKGSLDASLRVEGATELQAALTVAGASELKGGLTVAGLGELKGGLKVTGTTTVPSLTVTDGIIQRGGDKVTGTSDLGLYSQLDGNWVRFVNKNSWFRFYSDGGCGTAAIAEIDAKGNLNAVGSISAKNIAQSSDLALKSHVTPLGPALAALLRVRGVRFRWHDATLDPGDQIGVLAQDVEAVFPELVRADPRGHKTVQYAGLIAPLIEALREQQQQLTALQAELAARPRTNPGLVDVP